MKFSEQTQNKGYYAAQGHSRSSRSVSVESLYATDILSLTVSEISQLIVQIGDTFAF